MGNGEMRDDDYGWLRYHRDDFRVLKSSMQAQEILENNLRSSYLVVSNLISID